MLEFSHWFDIIFKFPVYIAKWKEILLHVFVFILCCDNNSISTNVPLMDKPCHSSTDVFKTFC